MKSMFRLASFMVLAASTSPLAFAIESNAGATAAATTAPSSALMQGCPADKNALELVREGLRAGHAGKTNTMATCAAFTMGFDEGKLHFGIRKANEEKNGAAKAKLLDHPAFAKLDDLKTSPRRCAPVKKYHGGGLASAQQALGGIRTGSLKSNADVTTATSPAKETRPLKPCIPEKRDSWADRQSEKANAERAKNGKSGDSAADRAAERDNASRGSSSGRDYSSVDREANKNVGSDNAARSSTSKQNSVQREATKSVGSDNASRSARTGNTNRDRQGSDGRSSSGGSKSSGSSSDRKSGPQ